MSVLTFLPRLIILLAVVQLPLLLSGSNTRVTGLRCEYLTNPLGLDIANPGLTWQIQSGEPNMKQTAYEIRVAESPAGLNSANKRCWSTGRVLSDQSVNIRYKGS
ncbi:MAG TPA: hypothetical protein VN249_11075, partial [Prolixibacteraceae bacterium]|nr:hypothetical protein [Prolixibacteraceae bacterium]